MGLRIRKPLEVVSPQEKVVPDVQVVAGSGVHAAQAPGATAKASMPERADDKELRRTDMSPFPSHGEW